MRGFNGVAVEKLFDSSQSNYTNIYNVDETSSTRKDVRSSKEQNGFPPGKKAFLELCINRLLPRVVYIFAKKWASDK